MTRSSLALAALALGVLLLFSAVASAAGSSQSTLALNAFFPGPAGAVACPPGTPTSTECYLQEGKGQVPGLGSTSARFTLYQDFPYGTNDPCRILKIPDATFTVPGKGEIRLTASYPSCQNVTSGALTASMDFIVTGGSGIYAGATGGGTMKDVVPFPNATSTWMGTLTVTGLDFDTTPPTISGANSKVVKVKKTTRRVRVSYAVTASDAADGTVPVTCTPRSGSFFPLGRTRVSCVATDSSANTGRASFTITVKRR